MKKLIAVVLGTVALVLGAGNPAWAAQANVTGCNSWEIWEDGINVKYRNPTITTVVYVTLTNGNLYAQNAWTTYVSTGVWVAHVFKPSTSIMPWKVTMTASGGIDYAVCANV